MSNVLTDKSEELYTCFLTIKWHYGDIYEALKKQGFTDITLEMVKKVVEIIRKHLEDHSVAEGWLVIKLALDDHKIKPIKDTDEIEFSIFPKTAQQIINALIETPTEFRSEIVEGLTKSIVDIPDTEQVDLIVSYKTYKEILAVLDGSTEERKQIAKAIKEYVESYLF